MRAASRTRVGLGVKTPVARIVIFRPAFRTQVEPPHRRVGPIIRQGGNDAEPGTTMGAVGKGVAKSAIARIKDLAETIRTGRDVRQDQHDLVTTAFAGPNFEILITRR